MLYEHGDIKQAALSTMGYLILRVVYIETINKPPRCRSIAHRKNCDAFMILEDINTEINTFMGDLDKAIGDESTEEFFNLFTRELSQGIYFRSKRIKDKYPEFTTDQLAELYGEKLLSFVKARVNSEKLVKRFKDAYNTAWGRYKQQNNDEK